MITLLEKHSNIANEVYEFIADSKSDLTNFETDVKILLHGKMCGTHSKCFVIETGTWFYYGADGTLTEAAESGGGSEKPIKLQAKDIDISENGETSVSPDYGYDGLSKVNIKTNVPGGGGVPYNIGHGLKVDTETNTLSVDTVSSVEQDNTLPITSAAVYAEVGNINALLGTI